MSTPAGRPTFRFGEFEVDSAAFELRSHGKAIRLPRQPMSFLMLLLEHRSELVTRDDIASRLWTRDVFVDRDAGIHTAVLKIRHVLGGRPSPVFVETVPGKGYRFVAPVEVVAASPERSPGLALPQPHHPPAHDNLPADLTRFIGRQKELAELVPLIQAGRLLSLTGAGGVGKTRLAVRCAQRLVDDFPHGVWIVDLGPLVEPDLIAQTIAGVIGVWESPKRTVREALIETLRQRELLLVLDTCEHLIEACARLAETLLRESPRLRIIATSRESLGVPGEIVYRVPSLSLPDERSVMSADTLPAFEATQLFAERASLSDPTFAPTDRDADVIARICRRLDGIPLAIELAAARVMVLSLGQIEARLQDRFRLLTGGARTAVARQRTLEATVEWSYQLLSDTERAVVARLAVFPSSWTLEAAENVVGSDGVDRQEMLDLLSRLVDKSLLVVERGIDGDRRYRFLETVRQYAQERLTATGQTDRLRDHHFHFFWSEFRDSLTILRGLHQVAHLRRLEDDQENIRAALGWGLGSAALADQAVELAGALFWFWTKRSLFAEGRSWLERAAAIDARPQLRARALIGLAHMHHFQGRQAAAAETAATALRLGRDVGESWAVSVALFLQALAAFELGDYSQARVRATEARQAADAGCDPVEHGGPLMILANLALIDGDLRHAQELYDQSIDIHRRAGDKWGLSILLSIGGSLLVVRGVWAEAHDYSLEAMALAGERDPRGLAWSLEVVAGLLGANGDAGNAARLWGAAEALLERVGGSFPPTIGGLRHRYLGPIQATLGAAVFERLRAVGRELPIAVATALAGERAMAAGPEGR